MNLANRLGIDFGQLSPFGAAAGAAANITMTHPVANLITNTVTTSNPVCAGTIAAASSALPTPAHQSRLAIQASVVTLALSLVTALVGLL